MIVPPKLVEGDKIAIVAPSRKVSDADIHEAMRIFASWKLQPVLSKNLFSNKHNYLAGRDEERLADFQQALDDPSIKAIICARGGYGSTRIVDLLDFIKLLKNPKWVIGFSDITAIHQVLWKRGICSIHGTMPVLFPKPDAALSIQSLKKILFDGAFKIDAEQCDVHQPGITTGVLVGGNLSLLVDSIGTKSELNTENGILLLEEIDEYDYRVDRMLHQLKRAGKLENLNALIIGHMTDIKSSSVSFGESVKQIVLNVTRDYSYPIIFNFPSGHENPNLAWIHGSTVSLEASIKKVIVKSVQPQLRYRTSA
jgi:muramoyltetrapeptide carboxypeptidase